MSREQYQVPTVGSQSFGGAGGGAGDSVSRPANSGSEAGPALRYICNDCGTTVRLTRGQNVRCIECGGRVLFKERTKRMVQFEAR